MTRIPTRSPSPHVVLGAGQVGLKVAELLIAQGHSVRIVRRGPAGPARAGLTWSSGDLGDPAFADEVCANAAMVYNCVNPPDYGRWAGVMEPLHEAVQDAAVRARVPLVGLDCLYMVGLPEAMPFTEDAPLAPRSAQGEMRARLFRRALELRERGDLRVTFGRAPDFFGPDSPRSLFGERFLQRLHADAAAEVFGDPDLPRSYAFTPDVARGLVTLGTDPRGFERPVWHLPVLEGGTTRELVETFYRMAGRAPKLRVVPSWVLGVAGVVSPLARAMRAMVYQWEHPFVVDDRRFRETFGADATPARDAVAATLAAEPALAAA